MSFKVDKISWTYKKLDEDEIRKQIEKTKLYLNKHGKIIVETSDYKIFAKEDDAKAFIVNEIKAMNITYENKISYFRERIKENLKKIDFYGKTD
jgi:hypothetical protein